MPGQPKIKPQFFKLTFVLVAVAGVTILAYCDSLNSSTLLTGAIWSIASSVFYAAYAVALNAVSSDEFDYALFLGFVGLINSILMVPIMILLHFWEV